MKVFYDHQAFSSQNYGGVSRIFAELLRGIPKQSNIEPYLSILISNNVYLKEFGLGRVPFFPSIKFPKKQGLIYRINDLYGNLDYKIKKWDIYHATYYNPSVVSKIKAKPTVATYHDMIHEKFSKVFSEYNSDPLLISNKKELINRVSKIIAVSHNTKKDLVEIYGIDESKIKVIHLGSSLPLQSQIIPPKARTKKPYFLFVGNRSAHKNFIPFVTAISKLLKANSIQLFCAGGGPFNANEMEAINKNDLSELLVSININDAKLIELYSNALAFVYPSLYEGFGIPLLEAFSCNCPCIVSNTSSLPEVAGNAAIYMDPYHPDSMYDAVESLINNPEKQMELIESGRNRVQHFSWEKHVNQTVDVYKGL